MFKWIRLLFFGKGKNKVAPATNYTIIETPMPPRPAAVDTGVLIKSIKPSASQLSPRKSNIKNKKRKNVKRKTKQSKRA